MAGPDNSGSRSKWPWIAVLVVLAILALVWLFSPSGEREGQVEDPIVTPEFDEQTAGTDSDIPPADRPGQGTDQGAGQDPSGQTAPAPEPFAPGGDPE